MVLEKLFAEYQLEEEEKKGIIRSPGRTIVFCFVSTVIHLGMEVEVQSEGVTIFGQGQKSASIIVFGNCFAFYHQENKIQTVKIEM